MLALVYQRKTASLEKIIICPSSKILLINPKWKTINIIRHTSRTIYTVDLMMIIEINLNKQSRFLWWLNMPIKSLIALQKGLSIYRCQNHYTMGRISLIDKNLEDFSSQIIRRQLVIKRSNALTRSTTKLFLSLIRFRYLKIRSNRGMKLACFTKIMYQMT